MARTHTVIIGAGHAGLAMSRCLTDRGVPHVVLDRGCVGERWRTARWDSFRLLTPNWLSRLPGWHYTGPEPDGFMSAGEFAEYLSGYAGSFDAPVRPHTPVMRLNRAGTGFAVHTDDAVWAAKAVVVATGYHSRAKVPDLARGLAPVIVQRTAARYRAPSGLPAGGVLVVGCSSSGVQIAHELARAGRPVVLAVGAHTRVPRRYRGRDILWWLDRIGSLDRTVDEVPGARDEPSFQLIDLQTLRDSGVRLVGRLRAVAGTTAEFAGDLAETTGAAQRRLDRVLARIDAYAALTPGAATGPPDPPPAIALDGGPTRLDLRAAGISAVVWATGYRPWYPWLDLPVLDAGGRIRHRRGVTDVPGLYAIGLRFQYRRSATLVDGARHDAAYLAERISDGHL